MMDQQQLARCKPGVRFVCAEHKHWRVSASWDGGRLYATNQDSGITRDLEEFGDVFIIDRLEESVLLSSAFWAGLREKHLGQRLDVLANNSALFPPRTAANLRRIRRTYDSVGRVTGEDQNYTAMLINFAEVRAQIFEQDEWYLEQRRNVAQ